MFFRREHFSHAARLVTAVGIVLLALAGGFTVFAAYAEIPLSCSPSTIPGGNVHTPIICSSSEPFTWLGSSDTYCGIKFDATSETGATGFIAWLLADSPPNAVDLDWDYVSTTSVNFPPPVLLGCVSESRPYAAGIWAADVCVGEDGHDANGWLTLDANTQPPDTNLWVASSADGPWYQTEFAQPPYIMSYEHTAGLAAWMGVASEGDLWFRPGETGISANLASMIADRASHMDELCDAN